MSTHPFNQHVYASKVRFSTKKERAASLVRKQVALPVDRMASSVKVAKVISCSMSKLVPVSARVQVFIEI